MGRTNRRRVSLSSETLPAFLLLEVFPMSAFLAVLLFQRSLTTPIFPLIPALLAVPVFERMLVFLMIPISPLMPVFPAVLLSWSLPVTLTRSSAFVLVFRGLLTLLLALAFVPKIEVFEMLAFQRSLALLQTRFSSTILFFLRRLSFFEVTSTPSIPLAVRVILLSLPGFVFVPPPPLAMLPVL